MLAMVSESELSFSAIDTLLRYCRSMLLDMPHIEANETGNKNKDEKKNNNFNKSIFTKVKSVNAMFVRSIKALANQLHRRTLRS